MHLVCIDLLPSPHPHFSPPFISSDRRRQLRCAANETSPTTSLTIKTNLFFSSAAKSWPLDRTLSLLPLLPAVDIVTWNTAISACLRHRRPAAALRLFHQMLLSTPFTPDDVTLRSVLNALSQSNSHPLLLPQLHSYILKFLPLFSPTDQSILITCLLNLCFKFELPIIAHNLFDQIPHRDVVAFTSMLVGCTNLGHHAEALRIFSNMVEHDCVEINEHAYSCALRACAGARSLFAGRQIHGLVVKSMMGSDVFVGSGLVDMYMKSQEMDSAKKAFSEIDEPNVVSWNSLLGGGLDGDEIMLLFAQMRMSDAGPDRTTLASVLRACCKDGLGIGIARQMHALVVKMKEVEVDVFVGGALVETYLDQGCFCDAKRIFGEMEKDDVAFNLAIQGFLRNGHEDEAIGLFIQALKMGMEVSDVTMRSIFRWVGELQVVQQLHALVTKLRCCDRSSITGSLVSIYTEHQRMDDAIHLFERIQSPDLVLWTSLISGFAKKGKSKAALNLYIKMISSDEGLEPPNHYTFSTLLSLCACIDTVEEGKQIHAQIIKSVLDIESDYFITTGLLYLYSKFGYLKESRWLFNKMPERDLASWNAMISSLSQHGFAEEAIEMFEELLNEKDLEPNHITYIGVLSACSRCGMIEEGCRYFKSIKEPTIDHYTCLIDLIGRAGWLREAKEVVEEMPFEANARIWSSLLAASGNYADVELGEYSARRLIELNPRDPGTYIALSNVYAAAGRWEDVRRVRQLMKAQADGRCSGVSWLRVDGENRVFYANGGRFESK